MLSGRFRFLSNSTNLGIRILDSIWLSLTQFPCPGQEREPSWSITCRKDISERQIVNFHKPYLKGAVFLCGWFNLVFLHLRLQMGWGWEATRSSCQNRELSLQVLSVSGCASCVQATPGHRGWARWHPVRCGAFRGPRLAGLHLHAADGDDAQAERWEAAVQDHCACSAGWDIRGEVKTTVIHSIAKVA